jgi:serine/threonine protein kinase
VRTGERIGERFVLDAQAGSGAMGVVYRAHDLATGRFVAVKLLKAVDFDSLARFQREASTLATLAHPRIVEYVTHGTTANGEPFLAMEWLSGETLKEANDRRPLSFVETVDVGRGVAAALVMAHARSIVHRDLKPANIFLVERSCSSIKVVDFGIARVRQAAAALTGTGAMLGTPAFMSPEQAKGARHVDQRSDFFSLGAILFRCIAGRPPFEGDDAISLLLALTSERAPPMRSLEPRTPPKLAAIVDALLAPNPAERPAHASAILAALDDARAEALAVGGGPASLVPSSSGAVMVTANSTLSSAPASAPPATEKRGPMRPLLALAAVLVLGMLAAFAALEMQWL